MNILKRQLLLSLGLFKKDASKIRWSMEVLFEYGYLLAIKKGYKTEQQLLIYAVRSSLSRRLISIEELDLLTDQEKTWTEILPFIYMNKEDSKKEIKEYVVMRYFPGEEDSEFLENELRKALNKIKNNKRERVFKYGQAFETEKNSVKWTNLLNEEELLIV